jgi:hypothetical protein
MSDPGVLAIFNDCRKGREAEFDAWFQGEHLIERLAVPGFLFGRRHIALSGSCGYFNFYLVDGPEVLTSKTYLERLDHPTPMTKMIMSDVFINMNRTLCTRTVRRGSFRGAYAVTARFNDEPGEKALGAQLDLLLTDNKVASGEIWIAVDPKGQPVSMEEKLRGGDKKIKACLMVDTLYQQDAERVAAQLAKQFTQADIGVFRVLCQLGRGDI